MKRIIRGNKKEMQRLLNNRYFVFTVNDIYTGYINKKTHHDIFKINKLSKNN